MDTNPLKAIDRISDLTESELTANAVALRVGFLKCALDFSVSVSHTAYTDPAVDRYASGCPNDDPPNNGALC